MADPLQQPAMATPPGVISQFPTTKSSAQTWYYVCASLSSVIPGTLLLLRLYTKLSVVRRMDLSDYVIVASFLCFISMLIIGRMCIAEGAAVHQWNVSINSLIGVTYWLYVGQIVYAPTIFLIKTALLLQYVRLFATPKAVNPFMWHSAWIIIVVTGIYYTISTFVTIFACSPREAIWNPLIENARCLDNNTGVFFTCLFNIVSDVIILLLPARAVWKLRIPTRKKVGIVFQFAIGLLACIANAMIIIYVQRLDGENADLTYNTAWEGLWVFAEISFGLIVACSFALPQFIEAKGTMLRGLFSSLTRSVASAMSFGTLTQSEKDTISLEEAALDRVTIMRNSDSDLPLTDRDQSTKSNSRPESVEVPLVRLDPVVDSPNGFLSQ